MATFWRVVSVAAGIVLVAWVLDAAIRNFMLPRASRVKLTQLIAGGVARVFSMVAGRNRSYEWRDRVLALRPPITLLAFQAVWLFLVFVGFGGIFKGVAGITWSEAFRDSGSALFTLGFATPSGGVPLLLVYGEAVIGLTLMALLISYLPTIYQAFQKREFMVAKLAVRSGLTPWRGLVVAHISGSMQWMDSAFWVEWENWFIDISESHTSLTILNFYRSPEATNHWISAARSVLDMAALRISVVDVPGTAGPHIAIRSGSIALRTLARHFRFEHDPDPSPSDPISLTRAHFDAACEQMEAAGVPLVADRDAAWIAFAGWRVNYDSIVEQAALVLNAPPSPWDALVAPAVAASAGSDAS
ncbi:MAG: hypothetical protein U0Q22_17860 [Acidimicrobiales bacterium]